MTEGEQIDDLLKKMMSEHQIDESSTPAGSNQVSDGDIEERLAKLQGIDPGIIIISFNLVKLFIFYLLYSG